jgi:hypothetical protein
MQVQGKFKMKAHIIISSVVMDVTAFKVSHSAGIDIDATTALRATRARSSSKGAMDESSGKFKMKAHIISSVVMDVAAFKVGNSVWKIDIDATAL